MRIKDELQFAVLLLIVAFGAYNVVRISIAIVETYAQQL